MSNPDIISIVESTLHPNYSDVYRQKSLSEIKVNSIRKAISLIKKQPVKYIVAEFFYAYSTNYSGVLKSNLDVLLISLRKYSPQCKLIVLAEKEEMKFVNVLDAQDFPIHAVLKHPTTLAQIEALIE